MIHSICVQLKVRSKKTGFQSFFKASKYGTCSARRNTVFDVMTLTTERVFQKEWSELIENRFRTKINRVKKSRSECAYVTNLDPKTGANCIRSKSDVPLLIPNTFNARVTTNTRLENSFIASIDNWESSEIE